MKHCKYLHQSDYVRMLFAQMKAPNKETIREETPSKNAKTTKKQGDNGNCEPTKAQTAGLLAKNLIVIFIKKKLRENLCEDEVGGKYSA